MKKFYKVTFERICFYFQPAVRQSTEVVFETRIKPDDPRFEELAWKALYKQMPDWIETSPMRENFTLKVGRKKFGWSSAMGGRHAVEIKPLKFPKKK